MARIATPFHTSIQRFLLVIATCLLVLSGAHCIHRASDDTENPWDPRNGSGLLLNVIPTLPYNTSVTGAMNYPRVSHSATLMDDGRVLVAGGRTLPGPSSELIYNAEIFDPGTGLFTDIGPAPVWSGSVAIKMPNGDILLFNGFTENAYYDVSAGSFALTSNAPDDVGFQSGPSSYYPDMERAVLTVGGEAVFGNGDGKLIIYDHDTQLFSQGGDMDGTRSSFMFRFQDGSIVRIGNTKMDQYTSDATSRTSSGPSLAAPQESHFSVSLSSDYFLACGHQDFGAGDESVAGANFVPRCDLYEPGRGIFLRTVDPPHAWQFRLIETGLERAAIIGGLEGPAILNREIPVTEIQTFNSVTESWQETGRLHTPRLDHVLTRLRDGRVLITGGRNTEERYDADSDAYVNDLISEAEIYDPPN